MPADPDFDKVKTPEASEQSSDPMDDIWGPLLDLCVAQAPSVPEQSSGLAPASEQLKTHEQTMVFAGSTTLSEATYNKMMQSLVMKFKRSPGAYSYFGVPPGVAEKLFGCEGAGQSAGKFFIKEIKNIYPFKKII